MPLTIPVFMKHANSREQKKRRNARVLSPMVSDRRRLQPESSLILASNWTTIDLTYVVLYENVTYATTNLGVRRSE